MKTRTLIVVCTLCLISLFRLVEAQDETAPFLYYYSDALRTFVIERADGTDRHVLSQVTMPEETNDIWIRGWSPSGEWLAWTSSIRLDDGNTIDAAWIANVDGLRWRAIPADAGNIYDIAWSPTEDLLFVSDWERTSAEFNYGAESAHRFFLIDAQTQTFITTFEMETSFADRSRAAWTLDGEYVTFTYTVDTEEDSEAFLRRISRAGEIEDIPITGIPEREELSSNPSPNAWLLSRSADSNQFITTNVFSGETVTFEAPSRIERVYLYQWNLTGDYALIYVRTLASEDGFELWLLSISDRTLQRVATGVGNYRSETSTWFPWSFYANHAVFYTDEGLFALKLEPELQVSLIEERFSLLSPQWYRDGRLYFTTSTETSDENPHIQAFTYDFVTETIAEQDIRFSPYRVSADERFAVVENPLSVVDRLQNQVFPIQSHSQVEPIIYLLEGVSWYLDEPWFITTETNRWINLGMYVYQRNMSVNNVEGTVHRELASCYSFCASWLPEQVLAHVESE